MPFAELSPYANTASVVNVIFHLNLSIPTMQCSAGSFFTKNHSDIEWFKFYLFAISFNRSLKIFRLNIPEVSRMAIMSNRIINIMPVDTMLHIAVRKSVLSPFFILLLCLVTVYVQYK